MITAQKKSIVMYAETRMPCSIDRDAKHNIILVRLFPMNATDPNA